MALEDRCSPQSAPSPPGIPHSPQNSSTLTTSITTLTTTAVSSAITTVVPCASPSFVNDLKINTSSINEEMSLRVSPQNHHQQHHNQQHNIQHKQKLIKQNYLKNHINPSKSIHIDIVEDDDYDVDNNTNNNKNNRDNDDADEDDDDDINIIDDNLNDSINQSEINFSITNILSESFGRTKLMTKLSNNNDNVNVNGSNGNKRDCLFRPYDIKSNKLPMEPIVRPAPFLPQSTYSNVRHMINEPYDFSNKAHRKSTTTTTTSSSSAASLAANNASHQFYEQLGSPTSYPKLHEEILNSNRKYLHHHSQYTTANKLTEAALSKIPPLGNLCKTVSQIGQNFPTILSTASTTTCATGSLSPKSDTSSITTTSTGNGIQLTNSNHNHNQSNQLGRDSLSGIDSSDDTKSECGSSKDGDGQTMWPAWVFCTRYSDRPSSGPRYRRPKKPKDKTVVTPDDKRPRTAFSSEQLARLKREFNENRYLTERRRQQLSNELGLNEAQIKIWFQNKRAKIKKSTGQKNPLALQLMAQGLYNHSTVPLTKEEEELEMRMNGQL